MRRRWRSDLTLEETSYACLAAPGRRRYGGRRLKALYADSELARDREPEPRPAGTVA